MERILKHKATSLLVLVSAGVLLFSLYNTYLRSTSKHVVVDQALLDTVKKGTNKTVTLAGGCFWCTESEYEHLLGVISAVSGYADVEKKYETGSGPSYKDVSSGSVLARESVQVIYDPSKISDLKILEVYFRHIDPTDSEGQFADRGYQYAPAVYYTTLEQKNIAEEISKKIDGVKKFSKPVMVKIYPQNNFYPAEEYHQNYKDKNAVRYAAYREASGRNAFIRKHWSDESSGVQEIFGLGKVMMTEVLKIGGNNNETTVKNNNSARSSSWKEFTVEKKEARLPELTQLQYNVTQKNGTESGLSNLYGKTYEKGIYVDIVSGEPLFLSSDKYDSGTGWPSFVKPISDSFIALKVDNGIFSSRTEVRSVIADSHLGHVFDDGPQDRGGKRYCMNSAALRFIMIKDMEREGYGEFITFIQ